MSRVAYVNGAFTRHADAAVHIEDRGYQFADGVYEVWAVFDGKLLDAEGHFTRLQRSLHELRITLPVCIPALRILLAETLRRNRIRDGLVYLQITRGVSRRDHPFPNPPVNNDSGKSLGTLRYQDCRTAAECPGKAGGP